MIVVDGFDACVPARYWSVYELGFGMLFVRGRPFDGLRLLLVLLLLVVPVMAMVLVIARAGRFWLMGGSRRVA
jgi:hypothetical protein